MSAGVTTKEELFLFVFNSVKQPVISSGALVVPRTREGVQPSLCLFDREIEVCILNVLTVRSTAVCIGHSPVVVHHSTAAVRIELTAVRNVTRFTRTPPYPHLNRTAGIYVDIYVSTQLN